MAEFETGLPSIRFVQSYIKDKREVEVKLVTGDVITGRVFWQDPQCICLLDPQEQPVMISRQALAYLKPKV